jgi:hypothetical protein
MATSARGREVGLRGGLYLLHITDLHIFILHVSCDYRHVETDSNVNQREKVLVLSTALVRTRPIAE